MREAIAAKRRVAPEIFMEVKNLETLARHSEKFELLDGLLYRRVYDIADGELQLRVCVCARRGTFCDGDARHGAPKA